MQIPSLRLNAAPRALAAAVARLASGGLSDIDIAAWREAAAIPAERIPVVAGMVLGRKPMEVVARRVVGRNGRPLVLVAGELRGRMPVFQFSIGLADADDRFFGAFEPWLARDGRSLWLASRYATCVPFPFFELSWSGLREELAPPWTSEQDRHLGVAQATIALARELEDEA